MDLKGLSSRKWLAAAFESIGWKSRKPIQRTIRMMGNLNRLTFMSVVSTCGKVYRPALIFPGKMHHYQNVKGLKEGVHDVLMDCFLFYRPVLGADSDIVYEWAKQFVEDAFELRGTSQHIY